MCSRFLQLGARARPQKKRDAATASLNKWRCHPDLNWGIKVLQTFALPLGYGTILIDRSCRLLSIVCGADNETRTRYLHLGKVALYQMSYVRIGASDRN